MHRKMRLDIIAKPWNFLKNHGWRLLKIHYQILPNNTAIYQMKHWEQNRYRQKTALKEFAKFPANVLDWVLY